MRKWFLILVLGVFFVFPSLAFAQTNITLANTSVQLWPEYDQPSMLVIVDFEVAANTQLPVDLTFHIPDNANLIAVAAYTADGSLINSVFEGPTDEGESQAFTITMDTSSARFEYYEPLTFNGNQRLFSYLWDNAYAVSAFNIRVLEPADTTSLTTTPSLDSIAEEDGLKYFEGAPVKIARGEQFILNLEYEKTTNNLIASPAGIEPAAPVDESTPGRVSLNNSLPYIIGGLGVVLIVGGIVYYWQAGRNPSKHSRRRTRKNINSDGDDSDDIDAYCPQCGERAKAGDRFCRVCGTRIRHQEE